MLSYLLIETQDSFESKDTKKWANLAIDLQDQGAKVVFHLLENGVLAARSSSLSSEIKRLIESGMEVEADLFSLKERGIEKDRQVAGLQISSPDKIIERMQEGFKVLWH
ncbi:MAG: DsrE family protein [Oligoflexales bacterium]|nr:DsrE family protein [Oligoflexales bacterium]